MEQPASERPTALFAVGDEMAIGAWAELTSQGIRVPDDFSIVGFDDHDLSATFGLTTVTQSVDKLGERAAHVLLDYIANPANHPDPEEWPVELVVRDSTAPPAIEPGRSGVGSVLRGS